MYLNFDQIWYALKSKRDCVCTGFFRYIIDYSSRHSLARPPGSHGESCELCSEYKWKDTTSNDTTSCSRCPPGTQTAKLGATSGSQCTVCTDIFVGGEPCESIRNSIIITFFAVVIPSIIITYIWRFCKKKQQAVDEQHRAVVQDLEYSYELMDNDLSTKLQDAKDDQLKLIHDIQQMIKTILENQVEQKNL